MSKRKKIHTIEDAITRLKLAEADNAQLRSLCEAANSNVVKLNMIITRFLKLKWYQRLFVKWDDPRLYKDQDRLVSAKVE